MCVCGRWSIGCRCNTVYLAGSDAEFGRGRPGLRKTYEGNSNTSDRKRARVKRESAPEGATLAVRSAHMNPHTSGRWLLYVCFLSCMTVHVVTCFAQSVTLMSYGSQTGTVAADFAMIRFIWVHACVWGSLGAANGRQMQTTCSFETMSLTAPSLGQCCSHNEVRAHAQPSRCSWFSTLACIVPQRLVHTVASARGCQ